VHRQIRRPEDGRHLAADAPATQKMLPKILRLFPGFYTKNRLYAGPVRHGWPQGVRNVLTVISSADGQTDVLRKMTGHLCNDIKMPAGSRREPEAIDAARNAAGMKQ
jgi:hypothetical protein